MEVNFVCFEAEIGLYILSMRSLSIEELRED